MSANKHINVASMVAARDQSPHVILKVGDQATQMTPEEARKIAMWVLSAAEAAEADAFFVKYFALKAELGMELAAAMLHEWRIERAKAQEGDEDGKR